MSGSAPPVPRLSARQRRDRSSAWLFMTPAIVALILVALWPLGKSISISFTDANFGSPGEAAFIGLRNYADVFDDRVWWVAVGNTLQFTVVSVALETVLGLGIALLLNQAIPARGMLRASILIPWAMPVVVSAKIWEWMLHDQFGIANRLLRDAGFIERGIAFMSEPGLALWIVIGIDVWITTPFMVLLILAGLQTIPREIEEAAVLDGIPAWRRLTGITLPLLRPAIGVAILFRTLDALRMFDLSYVLGGNGLKTLTISIYARNQLVSYQEIGLGSAASTLVFLIVATSAMVVILSLRLHRGTEV